MEVNFKTDDYPVEPGCLDGLRWLTCGWADRLTALFGSSLPSAPVTEGDPGLLHVTHIAKGGEGIGLLKGVLEQWVDVAQALQDRTAGSHPVLSREMRNLWVLSQCIACGLEKEREGSLVVVRDVTWVVQGVAEVLAGPVPKLERLVSAPGNIWNRHCPDVDVGLPDRVRGVGTTALWAVAELEGTFELEALEGAAPFYRGLQLKEFAERKFEVTLEALEARGSRPKFIWSLSL